MYNSLVETPSPVETAPETNPLRMLRSGLSMVRPRVRGNKHGTIGHSALHSEDMSGDHATLHSDLHQSGVKTLPKLRGESSANGLANPSGLTLNIRGLERHSSAWSVENNRLQSSLDENPIPLPPRDRSKTLQPKSSLPRHQRKHPLIIPGGGVTRTLAKMAVATSPVEDQIDGPLAFFPEESTSEGQDESHMNLANG